MKRLEDLGYSLCHTHGGFPRDKLLNLDWSDIDLVSIVLKQFFLKIFPIHILTNMMKRETGFGYVKH